MIFLQDKKQLYYHIIIFVIFVVLNYIFMNKQHFNIASESKYNILDSVYYTAVVHTSTGFGDISPKTDITKIITTAHTICVFAVIASILLLKDKI